jgi:hypothetical protein
MMTDACCCKHCHPSLSYAQKYADHLSQYGGYDARVAAITRFCLALCDPEAPMLPVVLSMPSDVDIAAVLPSSCAMDKTVLPTVLPARHAMWANCRVFFFPRPSPSASTSQPCAARQGLWSEI